MKYNNIYDLDLHDNNINKTIVYGHLHIAKTGGTNLNWGMAATYDNVCGNKGCSYNSYEKNQQLTSINNSTMVITNNKHKYDMKLIGYENCDYISQEGPYQIWTKEIVKQLFQKNLEENNNFVLELHIPCRSDPIQHLLSQCNHKNRNFECIDHNYNNITQQIKNCLWSGSKHDRRTIITERPSKVASRFHPKLLSNNPQIEIRCFNPFPIESYVQYMGHFLRKRKIVVPKSLIQKWSTNKERNKSQECLLSDDRFSKNETYLETIREIMRNDGIDFNGYYKFCYDCIGTNNELPIHSY